MYYYVCVWLEKGSVHRRFRADERQINSVCRRLHIMLDCTIFLIFLVHTASRWQLQTRVFVSRFYDFLAKYTLVGIISDSRILLFNASLVDI